MNRWKELICVLFDHQWEKRTANLLDGIFVSQLLTRHMCQRCELERTTLEAKETPFLAWAKAVVAWRKSGLADRVDPIRYGLDFAARIPDEVSNKKPTINSERRKHGIPPLPGSGLLRCGICGEETDEIHDHRG